MNLPAKININESQFSLEPVPQFGKNLFLAVPFTFSWEVNHHNCVPSPYNHTTDLLPLNVFCSQIFLYFYSRIQILDDLIAFLLFACCIRICCIRIHNGNTGFSQTTYWPGNILYAHGKFYAWKMHQAIPSKLRVSLLENLWSPWFPLRCRRQQCEYR